MTFAGILTVFAAVLMLCVAGVLALVAGIAASMRNYLQSLLMIVACACLTMVSGYLVERAEINFKIRMEASSDRK